MEVFGIKLTGSDARKEKEVPVTGIDLNISIDNLRVNNDEVTIDFIYLAKYRPDVGHLRIFGSVFGKENPDKAKKLQKYWEKDKKLPPEIAEPILNLINASAGVNGIMIARCMNLAPPFVPPRITVKK